MTQVIIFKKMAIPGLFSLFSSFQYSWQLIFNIIFCQYLDSNQGPLDRKQTLYQLSHDHCPKKSLLHRSKILPNMTTQLLWVEKSWGQRVAMMIRPKFSLGALLMFMPKVVHLTKVELRPIHTRCIRHYCDVIDALDITVTSLASYYKLSVDSMTRWWNKKFPNFSQKVGKLYFN